MYTQRYGVNKKNKKSKSKTSDYRVIYGCQVIGYPKNSMVTKDIHVHLQIGYMVVS